MSNTTCLSGGQPLTLSSTVLCLDGFYCPNNTATFPPEYCPPTLECFATRLQEAHNICDRPQGDYEPAICAAGSYCPSGGKSQITCPKGHFCPLGSVQPTPCVALSICPEGSSQQIYMIGFLSMILLDIFIAALGIYLARWKLPSLPKCLRFISVLKKREALNFEVAPVDDGRLPGLDQNSSSQQFLNNRFILNTDRVEISYQNISMRLRNVESMILVEQSGRIQPASFLGVMGFSGSGKSTLMNVISGRMKPTTGNVFVNGRVAKPAQLRDLIGFVPQDDILLHDLTVRENIMHSARIRLGGIWSKHEFEQYVDSLIISLGLSHVQDQLVGSPNNKRISGGQRKRVNVGLELAAAPSVLILDEPTSGLDTTTALSLIVSLKALTQRGMTVICVVHQPRVEIFEAFDQLMLLDSGRQVYLDRATEAYQRIAGSEKDPSLSGNSNPADMIMDLLSTPNIPKVFSPTTSSLPSESDLNENASVPIGGIKHQRAAWHVQAYLNFLRGMLQQTRHPGSFLLEMLSISIIGLLIGLSNYEFKGHLFQGLYKSPFERLSSAASYRLLGEQGMLCCLAIGCAAGPAGVQTFGNEKLVFFRESYSRHSRSAYFVGKVFSTFFRITLSALHFTTFYMVLTVPAIPFESQLTIDILYYYCIYGLGCFVAAVASPQNSSLAAMLISLIISALGGCAPRLASVKTWNLAWFWYIWPGLWYTEALFSESTAPQAHIYSLEPAAEETGYTFGRTNFDFGLIFLIGSLYHIVSFFIWDFLARRCGR